MITRVVGIGLIAAILSLLLRDRFKEAGILIGIGAFVALFFVVLEPLTEVIGTLYGIAERGGDNGTLGVILRVIGIAYITQFASSLCADAGEKAIAGKIELAGKIIILFYTIPIITAILDLVIGLLPT